MARTPDPNVLVDMETMDDAGVYRLTEEHALVQTADMFPPPVQDPVSYGRIVAANCMSDIWAMGAEPRVAVNLLCYPPANIPQEIIDSILRGGYEKMCEAGAALMGGHTQVNETVCYGLSVTGLIDPRRIITNAGARLGDRLILTKPIGSGTLTMSLKEAPLPEDVHRPLVDTMERLNKYACEAALRFDVHAMTDITGYGLLGHARELAAGSNVRLAIESERIPVLLGARSCIETFFSGGSESNREAVEPVCRWENGKVDESMRRLLTDAQTSGGLLIAVAPDDAAALVDAIRAAGDSDAVDVGTVEEAADDGVRLRVV